MLAPRNGVVISTLFSFFQNYRCFNGEFTWKIVKQEGRQLSGVNLHLNRSEIWNVSKYVISEMKNANIRENLRLNCNYVQ